MIRLAAGLFILSTLKGAITGYGVLRIAKGHCLYADRGYFAYRFLLLPEGEIDCSKINIV